MIIKNEQYFQLNEQESQELEETGYVITDDGYCFAEHNDCIMVFKELDEYSTRYLRSESKKIVGQCKSSGIKVLDALSIIIKKGVDVGYINTCTTLEEYNAMCWNDDTDCNKKLIQEEFDTVKRWLDNEQDNS